MRRFVPALLFFYLLQASSLQAQVVEYFTDGELGADPPWFGDTADFRVNAEGMLQLNAAAAGSSTIYTANYLCDSTEWLFRIRLTFSPSSNNYARIYLMADSLGPAGPFHGYFLQLGESGSADALTLCRDSAGQYHTLCRGPDGQIASAFDLEVKIIRSRKGSWILYAKETASPEYLWLAGAVDSCIRTTRWCSFSATYTSSNTSAFYLDDLIIREVYVDTQPPILEAVSLANRREILLQASEPLEAGALDRARYVLQPTGIQADSVVQDAMDLSHIRLLYNNVLPNGAYRLEIAMWCDLDSNCATHLGDSLHIRFPEAWDVVFNEIMMDEDPVPYGLPATEYIELFNRCDRAFVLEGWTLHINQSLKYLPTIRLEAGGYALVTARASGWENYPEVYPLFGMSLPNEGGELHLYDEEGKLMAGLNYSKSWFKDKFREQGGWSLEQIDSERPWDWEENWAGSLDPRGGSPGEINNQAGILPDLTPPRVLRLYPVGAKKLKICFSEPMESEALETTENYAFLQDALKFVKARKGDALYQSVILEIDQASDSANIHQLRLSEKLRDLSGNPPDSLLLSFGYPVLPQSNDIIINEMLFNPWPGGEDFVEIYNRTEKVFDLQWLRLCGRDPVSGEIEKVCQIAEDSLLFMPGAFRVLTPDGDGVLPFYPHSRAGSFTEIPTDFPSFPDKEGSLALALYSGEIIDQWSYAEKMHSAYVGNPEGVSLERISTEKPTHQESNWMSAPWNNGSASPGRKNSQAKVQGTSESFFHLSPHTISPNGDGKDDYFTIKCLPPSAGSLMNIRIYSESGVLVRNLAYAQAMTVSEPLVWTGDDDQGNRLPNGRYVVLAQYFSADGQAQRFKDVIWIVPR